MSDDGKVRKSTQATRARRKRQKSRLQSENKRLLSIAAAALERCEVADDPSGAADEAAFLLRQVVTLDGKYVPPGAPRVLHSEQVAEIDVRGAS